jgi:hypothetical protein
MSRGIWGDPQGLAEKLGTIWAWLMTGLVAVVALGLAITTVLTIVGVLGGPDRWLAAVICSIFAMLFGFSAVVLAALIRADQ